MVEVSAEVLRAAGRLRACLGPLVRRLRQIQAEGELTLSQASVLARLERDGPAAPGALAAGEHIRPQSVGATLAALEARGLVARRPDPGDGRRVVFSITKPGQVWVHGSRQEKAQWLAHAIGEGLTSVEQRQLISAIPLLERLAQFI
jgi:DNA-binding MarR family transcriptional regulator